MNWKSIIEKKYKGKLKVTEYQEFPAFRMILKTEGRKLEIEKEIFMPLNAKRKEVFNAIEETIPFMNVNFKPDAEKMKEFIFNMAVPSGDGKNIEENFLKEIVKFLNKL